MFLFLTRKPEESEALQCHTMSVGDRFENRI